MSAHSYIEYVFLHFVLQNEFDQMFSHQWIEQEEFDQIFRRALRDAFHQYGYTIGPRYIETVEQHLANMKNIGVISLEGDEYAGTYCFLNIQSKDNYVASVLADNPVKGRVRTLGDHILPKALATISKGEGWVQDGVPVLSDESKPYFEEVALEVPASDRIVSLSHNQQEELEQASTALIDTIEPENSIDGDTGLRQRILGELRAARELIRAQTLRSYLLHQTVITALGTLIEKYKGELIGELAKKLLDLFISHIFGK